MKRVILETLAVALYESFVRNQSVGRVVHYPDWWDLTREHRQTWRERAEAASNEI